MSDDDKRGRDQISGSHYPVSDELNAYFVAEEQAEYRSEFYEGSPWSMAGGSPGHSLIIANIIGNLYSKLIGDSCNVYDGNLKIFVSEEQAAFYPDVSIVCGDPVLLDKHRHAVLNPSCLIEVLSESTAAFDRGRKFRAYQKIPSLQAYLLVHQQQAQVELFQRANTDSWFSELYRGLEASILIPHIGIELGMQDIYQRVAFDELMPPQQ